MFSHLLIIIFTMGLLNAKYDMCDADVSKWLKMREYHLKNPYIDYFNPNLEIHKIDIDKQPFMSILIYYSLPDSEEVVCNLLKVFILLKEVDVIPKFIECVEHTKKRSLFITTERLYGSLAIQGHNYKQFKIKNGCNLSDRISTYIKIAEKLNALHQSKLAHANLVPSSIWSTDESFNDFRLLGMELFKPLNRELEILDIEAFGKVMYAMEFNYEFNQEESGFDMTRSTALKKNVEETDNHYKKLPSMAEHNFGILLTSLLDGKSASKHTISSVIKSLEKIKKKAPKSAPKYEQTLDIEDEPGRFSFFGFLCCNRLII